MSDGDATGAALVRYAVGDDHVAVVTLDRPDRRNALTLPLLAELDAALARADDDAAVRAVIVTGAGPAFSVGAELKGADTLRLAVADDDAGRFPSGYREPAGRITERIFAMRVPVIAALNGDAIGGGATIAAAMDVRIASDTARFGFVFPRRGVTPEGASTWFLPRLVGHGRATDWLVTGRVFDAAEALSSGFVGAVVPADQVLARASALAAEISTATSAQSVAVTRRLLAASWATPHPALAAANESAAYSALTDSDDAREGILSFLERRPARFTSTGREPRA
jgi:enoyl-CoA hydratase/carnithine racemase